MQHIGDRDGKSKTSSAVDAEHYPDSNGQQEEGERQLRERDSAFSHSEVAALAYKIWQQSGRPAGSHEQDWLEAERQLAEARHNRTDAQTMAAQAGSVQR